MLSKEDLKAENYRECWINVYRSKYSFWYGTPRYTKYEAEMIANHYCIYRIHVKLK